MLKNALYKIETIDHANAEVHAMVDLDVADTIFEGHFPGQPVLPGACMVQMIKEILEQALNKSLRLTRADNLKFLVQVDPRNNNWLQANIKYNTDETSLKVNAELSTPAAVCFKLQGMFVFR